MKLINKIKTEVYDAIATASLSANGRLTHAHLVDLLRVAGVRSDNLENKVREIVLGIMTDDSGQFIAKLKQLDFPSPSQHYGELAVSVRHRPIRVESGLATTPT